MLAHIDIPQAFEATMMICFGISWPVAVIKTLRSRRVEGKSFHFLVLVFLGYLAGLMSKAILADFSFWRLQPVTALYAFNAIMVATDGLLYVRYSPKPTPSYDTENSP